MTNRLVWNFEFTPTTNFILSDLGKEKEDELKWEARFFWPETEIITLLLLDNALLELTHYQHKQKKDKYYLQEQNYNIKNRRDELVYKPLIKQGKYSLGFGHKINLSELNKSPESLNSDLNEMMQQLKHSIKVLVKKESFSYKFSTHPNVKLELARIEINSSIYFTLCIEGKSRVLVEAISRHLVGKKVTDDYVKFLKKISQKP
jgi:hypothetical protein